MSIALRTFVREARTASTSECVAEWLMRGTAIAEMTPIMTTTITNSTRLNA